LQSGEVQRAVDLYRESITDDPKNGRTYYNLGLALDRLGDYRSERDALEKGIAVDPKFAPLHNQIGFLSLQVAGWMRLRRSQNRDFTGSSIRRGREQSRRRLWAAGQIG